MGELTQAEREVLAREVAADNYVAIDRELRGHEDFRAGWDAAMDYVAAQFDDDNDDPELSAALRKLTPEQLNKILREELGR
jgi:hypothetical protein